MTTKGPLSGMEQFLQMVSELREAYTHAGLSYHAVRDGSLLTILHARLFLDIHPINVERKSVSFLDQEIGHFSLEDLNLEVLETIKHLFQGKALETPSGQLLFPLVGGGTPSATFRPLHELGLPASRLAVLTLTGAPLLKPRFSLDLDWDLKANNPPYDSLGELLAEYRLAGYTGDFSCIEIPVAHVAWIDLESKVTGEIARPGVFLSPKADRQFLSLGIIVYDKGKALERLMLPADQLQWTLQEGSTPSEHPRGEALLMVPVGATMKCFAVYKGIVQHLSWIGDPGLFPNWRRTAYDWVDPQCEVLIDCLFDEKKRRKESQDFEIGVASLFWMLGFGPLHLLTPRLKDNPDLLVATPGGRMALVECTTDVIDKENKLSKLHSRAQSIKSRLENSGARYLELLPILITALPTKSVIDIEKASRFGILVLTQDDLRAAVGRSVFPQDPDALFQEQFQVLEARQQALGPQESASP